MPDPASLMGNIRHPRLGFSALVVYGIFKVICPAISALRALVRTMMLVSTLSGIELGTVISGLIMIPLLHKLEAGLDDAMDSVFELLSIFMDVESLYIIMERDRHFDNIEEDGGLNLRPSEVVALPKVKYGSLRSGYTNECAICWSSLQEEDDVRVLPACEHFFHLCCIDTWLLHRPNCPICRRSVPDRL